MKLGKDLLLSQVLSRLDLPASLVLDEDEQRPGLQVVKLYGGEEGNALCVARHDSQEEKLYLEHAAGAPWLAASDLVVQLFNLLRPWADRKGVHIVMPSREVIGLPPSEQ